MSWILFSILAALLWAIVNTLDKYILTKWIRKPVANLLILGIVGVIASIIVYFVRGFAYMSWTHMLIVLFSGIFYVLMNWFYFKAAQIEEISRIVPIFYITPIFIMILAAIFLGETFSFVKYVGIFLLIIGAILVSTRKVTRIKLGMAFWFMILSTLSLAINQVTAKYLLNFSDFWTVFSWTRISAMVALIPFYVVGFNELKRAVKKHGKRVVGTITASESINVMGVLFITIATSIGYVTLVNSLSSVQPVFVLLIAIILSVFYPKIIKEEIGKGTLLQKIIAIIMILIGAILIS